MITRARKKVRWARPGPDQTGFDYRAVVVVVVAPPLKEPAPPASFALAVAAFLGFGNPLALVDCLELASSSNS